MFDYRFVTRRAQDADIVIGLVNLMPPAAMRTIENLFRCLLNAFAPRYKIHLRLFAPQNNASQTNDISTPHACYEELDALWESPGHELPLDAIIVTGTEPRAHAMTEESCWPDLQKLCDWAGQNTLSAIWSCLSAHAAVLHMDNIHRQPLSEKLTGVFECEKVSDHPLFINMPAHWPVPHSRYNTLNEAELEANGYEILSRSPQTGADSFTKQHKNSQFLFFQGHLEYGAEMLFAEYCRDIKRFSLGQSATYPKIPKNYFDQTAMNAFLAAENAPRSSPDMLSSTDFVNSVTARLNNNWQAPARQLCSAWLSYIAGRKTNAKDKAASDEFTPAFFKALPFPETRGHIALP